jgi:outer membrane protein assembly factor BamE (lipoprotein component of BamABCDE complex)
MHRSCRLASACSILGATLLATCLAIGCATHRHVAGVPIKDEAVKQIIKGQTTMTDVIALMGDPQKSTRMGDETIYVYEYKVTKSQTAFIPYSTSTDSSEEVDKLSITFDSANIVKTYNLTRGIAKP